MITADKLQAATISAAHAITYVGGYVTSKLGATSDMVISLTSLTGGIASAPQERDIVIAYVCVGGTADVDLEISGYTEISELYANSTIDTNLLAAYKIMGATADTSLTIVGGSQSTSNALAIAIEVWRYVDNITPMDVTATTATLASSVLANPASITPATSGAVIVAGGGGSHGAGTQTFSSSDLTSFLTAGGDDTNDTTIGLGYSTWTSGAFDPAAFTFSTGDSTGMSSAAITIALRPKSPV